MNMYWFVELATAALAGGLFFVGRLFPTPRFYCLRCGAPGRGAGAACECGGGSFQLFPRGNRLADLQAENVHLRQLEIELRGQLGETQFKMRTQRCKLELLAAENTELRDKLDDAKKKALA